MKRKAEVRLRFVSPRAVSDETSERGGVSPLVLGRKPSLEDLEEPLGLTPPRSDTLSLYVARGIAGLLAR